MTKADPLIDLDTLPADVVEPIRAWVDEYRNTPRFERQGRVCGIDFAIGFGPGGRLIRFSELKALFARATELAEASAHTLRTQAAELEAENDFALTKGRNTSLKGQLAAAIRAEARAVRRLGEAQEEARKQVTRELNDLAAQKVALLALMDDLLRENEQLGEALEAERAARQEERASFERRTHRATRRGDQQRRTT